MDIVPLCRNRLTPECDAYIGIFGFRYGWIPNGITHLECRWALDRWPGHLPCPVFLFLPEAGSEAEGSLKERALAVLLQEFPDAPERRGESQQKQRAFLAWLSGLGRRIQFYRDETDPRPDTLKQTDKFRTPHALSFFAGVEQA